MLYIAFVLVASVRRRRLHMGFRTPFHSCGDSSTDGTFFFENKDCCEAGTPLPI